MLLPLASTVLSLFSSLLLCPTLGKGDGSSGFSQWNFMEHIWCRSLRSLKEDAELGESDYVIACPSNFQKRKVKETDCLSCRELSSAWSSLMSKINDLAQVA